MIRATVPKEEHVFGRINCAETKNMQKRVEAVDINGFILSCNFARYPASSTKIGNH